MADNSPSFGLNDYKVIKKETCFKDGMFAIARYHLQHKLYDAGWSEVFTRTVFERNSAIAILPYDPALDRVILIEQFRAGAVPDGQIPWLIEIIAGTINPGDDLEQAVLREAREEAGCEIQAIYPLHNYFVSPGASNEYLHVFIGKTDARNISGIHGLEEEHENIRVLNLPAAEAFAMLRQGKINTVPAILSLQWLEYNREHLLQVWHERGK